MQTQKPVVKFGTHHFPAGTVFTIDNDFGKEEFYKVAKVIRNGYHSYVLETTTPNNSCQTFIDMKMMYTFNISHVVTIEKRGTGPLIIEDEYSNGDTEAVLKMLEREQNRLKKAILEQGYKINRNDIYVPFECFQRYVWLYTGENNLGTSVSGNKVNDIASQSPFMKRIHCDYGIIFVIKKKKFKKWANQNKNRFYCNVEKAQSEYDEIMNSDVSWGMGDDGDDSAQEPRSENQDRIDGLVDQALSDDHSTFGFCPAFNGDEDIFEEIDRISKQEEINPPDVSELIPSEPGKEKPFEQDM